MGWPQVIYNEEVMREGLGMEDVGIPVEAKVELLPEQPGDVPITFADVSKAGRMLGYAPKVPIQEGLKRVAAWYRGRAPR